MQDGMNQDFTKSVAKAIAEIREFAATTSTNRSRLALDAGLSRNALRKLHSPNWQPTPDTLDKLLSYIRSAKARKTRPSRSPVRADLVSA